MSANFLDLLRSLGPETMQLMNDPKALENFNRGNVVSSGVLAIDIASGIGGYCRNRIIEVFGVEGGGKSTIAAHACAVFNKMGMFAGYIDMEHAVDMPYFMRLGVRKNLFALSQPKNGEEALETAITLATAGDLGILVLDSVAALMTKQELEGELDDANMGATARLMARSLRKLVPLCSVHNTMMMFINQNRDNIGSMFGGSKQPGGRALRYAASMRIELTRITTNKEGTESISNETKAHFKKNRLAPPFKEEHFNIIFGKGADNTQTIIEQGVKRGILEKKKNTVSYKGTILGTNKKAVKETLFSEKNKALKEEIWNAVLVAIKPKTKKKKKDKVLVVKKTEEVADLSVTEKPSETISKVPGMLTD